MTLLHAKWMGASTQNSQTHIIMADSKSPAFFPTFVTNALFLRVCGFHVPSPDILGLAYSTLRLTEKSVRQRDFGPRRRKSQHPFRFFIRAVFFLHLRPMVTLDMTWQQNRFDLFAGVTRPCFKRKIITWQQKVMVSRAVSPHTGFSVNLTNWTLVTLQGVYLVDDIFLL